MWWKFIAGAVVLGIAALALKMLTARAYDAGKLDERIEWTAAQRDADKIAADQRVTDAQRATDAVVAMASEWQRLEPVIVRSTETVRDYAKTPAGALRCLDAERMRGIAATASALGLSPAASASPDGDAIPGEPVSADAMADTG